MKTRLCANRSLTLRLGALLVAVVVASPSVAMEGRKLFIKTHFPAKQTGAVDAKKDNICWLPKDIEYVRGVVVAHPMIFSLGTGEIFQKVATDENLGLMVMRGFTWDTDNNWNRLDKVLEDWAEQTGHPELKGAPVFVSGLSASVLMARLLVYERPDRVFGILHVAGGNLHHRYPEGKSLAGVPFMAVNGEYETCGPEGGIRPHMGFDTQWYMMGEGMLERRREDPNHLMSLVVVPVKGHGDWNHHLAALFIRKCAGYRIPKERRDGSSPAVCAALKVEDGWLTHRNVKYPKQEPAAWADYKGDKIEAFWHLDEEMARAVRKYHADGIRPGQKRAIFRPDQLFNRIWPVGERMDIPFKGHSQEDYAAAIGEWVTTKSRDPLHPIALKHLSNGISRRLKQDAQGNVDEGRCRAACLRVCYAYHDAYLPIEAAIEKADLPTGSKDRLREYYACMILDKRANGFYMPALSVRGIQSFVATLKADSALMQTADREAFETALEQAEQARAEAVQKEYGPLPSEVPALLKQLGDRNAKKGWAAVDKLAAIGKPAIPELLRVMEWTWAPRDFRAAGALGRMGKDGVSALPDLERIAATGGRNSTRSGLICEMAFEAIDKIRAATE